jgi:serine/threonine-protein kinase
MHIKVLDFGIAKVLREAEEKGGTKSKFASFTWGYAAPEQLDPRVGAQGLATDVYAFALVITELLTDRPPVDGRDVVGLVKAATDPTIRPTPRQRGANVPDWLETVCRRALAVDPRGRYPTIGEFWTALTLAQSKPRASAPALITTGSSGQQPAGRPVVTPPPMPRPSYLATPPPMTPPPMTRAPITPQQQQRPSAPMPQYGMPPRYAGPAPMVPYNTPQQPVPPQTGWGRRPVMPVKSDSGTIALVIILMVLGVLFVGTCAVVHSAC